MPENSVLPSQDDAGTSRRASTKAQIIPIDDATKSFSLFISEQKLAEHKPDATAAAVEPTPAGSIPAESDSRTEHTPNAARGTLVSIRGAAIALLVLAVVSQAGFIAYEKFWVTPVAVVPVTGTLRVTSEPDGAAVIIDGATQGKTPLEVSLSAGAHTVAVGTGPQSRSQNITMTAGSTFSLHQGMGVQPAAGLEPGTGSLQIATEPAGARVWVDGAPHGVSPVTVTNLKLGDHVVTVRGSSGDAINRTVTVQEFTTASLVVSMTSPGTFASGWLAVQSSIPLQILERGTIIGTTDSPRILLPTGAHELDLVNTELGYRSTRTVQIAAGQTAAIAFKPPMGTISINAAPWAEVFIDGLRTGETPIGNLSIAIGKHDLVFRHPELGERVRQVTVALTNPVRVSVDMRAK